MVGLEEQKERLLRKMGNFSITLAFLTELLMLPKSDEIAYAVFEYETQSIKVIVRGDDTSDLPLINEGERAIRVMPIYHEDENGKVTFVSY